MAPLLFHDLGEPAGRPRTVPVPVEHDHPAVEAVGFDPETAERLGIGFAAKGMMRGTVAIPIRTTEGVLVGYIGITEARLLRNGNLTAPWLPSPRKARSFSWLPFSWKEVPYFPHYYCPAKRGAISFHETMTSGLISNKGNVRYE